MSASAAGSSAAAAPKPAAESKTAAATDNLPRTGPSSWLLVLLAGVTLAAGGISVLGGARRQTT